jgi:retron-type reverse transcriptase
MEEMCERGNMRAVLQQVKANKGAPGLDAMRVEALPAFLKVHWPAIKIKEQLLQGTYHPQAIKRVEIPKPGSREKRKLGIPCVLDRLMTRLAQRITDKRVLKLIRAYLQAGILEEGLMTRPTEGTPQGAPLSPFLSNVVLGDFRERFYYVRVSGQSASSRYVKP